MVDRNPFSMRLVVWAAIVVLLLQPESLLGASFQMSFGAVVALIAVYETGAAKRPAGAGGLDWRLAMYVAGLALTTIVASAATTPFSIYHFSRFPTYGIVTNLVAVPLTGIWIMPLGMLGILLIPFGLAEFCFVPMGWGIELIVKVAAFVAGLPGAALAVPRPPLAALLATVLGGLWLLLLAHRLAPARADRGRDRAVPDAARAAAGRADRRPRRARRRASRRRPPRALAVAAGQVDHRRLAAERRPGSAGRLAGGRPRAARAALRCDAEGCVLRRHGRTVALARRPEALETDCGRRRLS